MKEKRMKSTRYRFWRNVVFIAVGGVVGFIAGSLVGYYDLAVEIDFSQFISLKAVQDIMIVAIFLLFLGTLYYLHISRESMSRLEKMEDDEEIESLEQAGNRAYALAGILTNLMQIPFMFYAATGFAEGIRHTDFNILLAFGKLFFLVLLITVASILVRKGFKTVNGEELPRYSNVRETRDFLMDKMDEAEKQINYEENFELVMKLVSFIFPSIYIGLILLNLLFQLDTILAWIAVSIIYLYVTVSQYKIVKRYYK